MNAPASATKPGCPDGFEAPALPGIEIPAERLLRVMGYRQGAPVRAQVRDMAEAMAALAMTAARPAVCCRRVPISGCTEQGLHLSTGTRFRGPTFASGLAGCGEVAIFILSLGSRFDGTQKNLAAAGKTLEAYMMEVAGWLGIESATGHFRGRLAARALCEGLALSRRMGPGYSSRVEGRKVEWPLEDQHALFSLFEGVELPARLLDGGFAMTPKMSRTGLYGLRPAH